MAEHFDEAFSGRAVEFGKKLIEQLQIEIHALAELGIDLPDGERERLGLPGRDEQAIVPCDPRDLASTMLCVVVKGNRYVAAHVGDGVIGVERTTPRGRRLAVLSHPDNGEFANETIFITSASAVQTARIVCGCTSRRNGPITGFLLMSDGPEAALYDKRKRSLVGACSKLLEASRQLEPEEMNEQLEATLIGVITKKTSDDCSIALMAASLTNEPGVKG